MPNNNYPSLIARLLGQRKYTTAGDYSLHWRGHIWARVGAVWIPIQRINTLF